MLSANSYHLVSRSGSYHFLKEKLRLREGKSQPRSDTYVLRTHAAVPRQPDSVLTPFFSSEV